MQLYMFACSQFAQVLLRYRYRYSSLRVPVPYICSHVCAIVQVLYLENADGPPKPYIATL